MKLDIYKCRDCGFIGSVKLLQCPRCKSKDYKYWSYEVRQWLGNK